MGLLGYVVAGLIVGALVRVVRPGSGHRLSTLLVFGTVGAAIGGLGANLVRGNYFDHLDALGFTAAVLVALALLVGLDARARRSVD